MTLDEAQAIMKGQSLRRQAERVIAAHEAQASARAKRDRGAKGRAPRATGKTPADRRAERDAHWTATKEAVARRVDRERQGRCEWACDRRAEDPHHILGGSRRRTDEAPETVAGVCRDCHRAFEKLDEETLGRAFRWAMAHGFLKAARAIEARIEKVVAMRLVGEVRRG